MIYEIGHQETLSKRNDVDQEIVQSKLYEYFLLKIFIFEIIPFTKSSSKNQQNLYIKT